MNSEAMRAPSASMGPQLDSCGRHSAGARGIVWPWASMGPQLDSCGRGRRGKVGKGDSVCASMGPQLDSCGRLDPDGHQLFLRTASMGPQLDSCGRGRAVCVVRVPNHASMGPQLDSCGRGVPCQKGGASAMLQWGRNLTVAEGRAPTTTGRAGTSASMGPQLDSCGRAKSRRRARSAPGASMGPQLDSCGRWPGPPGKGPSATLQWGRNLTVAEGSLSCESGSPKSAASMGPQLDSCGRPVLLRVDGRDLGASMGPQLDSCGRRCSRLTARPPPHCFNGAAT